MKLRHSVIDQLTIGGLPRSSRVSLKGLKQTEPAKRLRGNDPHEGSGERRFNILLWQISTLDAEDGVIRFAALGILDRITRRQAAACSIHREG